MATLSPLLRASDGARNRGLARRPQRIQTVVVRGLLLVSLVACGAKPPQSAWVESDGLGTSTKDSEPIVEGTPVPTADISKLDLRTLDQAKIDTLDELTLRAVLDKLGTTLPAARVALRAAKLAWHRGDRNVAQWLLSRATGAADQEAIASDASALSAQLVQPAVDPKTIAVLLPLTGKYAAIGSELKVAIQLSTSSGTTWLFLDTKGEPAGAVAAVEQARAKGAAAILGPASARRSRPRVLPRCTGFRSDSSHRPMAPIRHRACSAWSALPPTRAARSRSSRTTKASRRSACSRRATMSAATRRRHSSTRPES